MPVCHFNCLLKAVPEYLLFQPKIIQKEFKIDEGAWEYETTRPAFDEHIETRFHIRTSTPNGIIPASESIHAVQAEIIEAEKSREQGKGKTILFNLSRHGLFDLSAYEAYMNGLLEDELQSISA